MILNHWLKNPQNELVNFTTLQSEISLQSDRSVQGERPPILSDENVFVQLKEKSRYARSYFKMFNKSHDFEVSHPGEESIIFQLSG